jgi:hypothetical protein
VRRITLTQGKTTLVDDQDYYWLSQFKWRAQCSLGHWYAVRSVRRNGKLTAEMMHRIILGLDSDDGRVVDHMNHDGLDNQRSNLRPCSHGQNEQNRGRKTTGTSRALGVYWDSNHKKWRAQVSVNKKRVYIKDFTCEDDAIEARNHQAIRFQGDFASINVRRIA